MEKLTKQAEQIMVERFGRDTVIALATEENGTPYVRFVNAFYEDGCFYMVTHGLSNKMKQIANNPIVAISGEWFTAHETAKNLGYWDKKENADLAEKLRRHLLSG